MPLILACPFNRKKYLCTKGVDLKVLVFLVNLCQPVCPKKECDLFWQTAQSHFAELWRGFACLKDNVAQRDIPRRLHSSGSCLALQKMAVRLATCICLCRISQTRENKTALWAAGVKVLREQVVAISTEITWPNMVFLSLWGALSVKWKTAKSYTADPFSQTFYCNTGLWMIFQIRENVAYNSFLHKDFFICLFKPIQNPLMKNISVYICMYIIWQWGFCTETS